MSTNVSAECLFGFGNLDDNSEVEGVPLPLAQAGTDRLRCAHSRRDLRLNSWTHNPCKLLIIKIYRPLGSVIEATLTSVALSYVYRDVGNALCSSWASRK